mgnify:CR=1 FL=1
MVGSLIAVGAVASASSGVHAIMLFDSVPDRYVVPPGTTVQLDVMTNDIVAPGEQAAITRIADVTPAGIPMEISADRRSITLTTPDVPTAVRFQYCRELSVMGPPLGSCGQVNVLPDTPLEGIRMSAPSTGFTGRLEAGQTEQDQNLVLLDHPDETGPVYDVAVLGGDGSLSATAVRPTYCDTSGTCFVTKLVAAPTAAAAGPQTFRVVETARPGFYFTETSGEDGIRSMTRTYDVTVVQQGAEFGGLAGTVVDELGRPLAGVGLTLTGVGFFASQTTPTGGLRKRVTITQ